MIKAECACYLSVLLTDIKTFVYMFDTEVTNYMKDLTDLREN